MINFPKGWYSFFFDGAYRITVLNPLLSMCENVDARLKLSKSLMCQYSYIGMVLFVLKSESENIFSLLYD